MSDVRSSTSLAPSESTISVASSSAGFEEETIQSVNKSRMALGEVDSIVNNNNDSTGSFITRKKESDENWIAGLWAEDDPTVLPLPCEHLSM